MKKQLRLLLSLSVVLLAGAFYLRSRDSWRLKTIFQSSGEVSHLVFSSDGQSLLVVNSVSTLPPGMVPDRVTAFSSNPRYGPKRLWQRNLNLWFEKDLQFFDHNARILAGGDSIRVLDARTGLNRASYGMLNKAVISSDDRWMAYSTLGNDRRVHLRPVVSLSRLPIPTRVLGKQGEFAHDFAFSPDDKRLLVSVQKNNSSRLDVYDTKTWRSTCTWNILGNILPDGSPSVIQQVRWSYDGQHVLCYYLRLDNNLGLKLFRVRDGKTLSTFLIPPTMLEPFIQSDGRILSVDTKGHVFLRALKPLSATDKPLLFLPNEAVSTAALSPNGSVLVVGTYKGRVLWQRLK